jgi:hypothetical protein
VRGVTIVLSIELPLLDAWDVLLFGCIYALADLRILENIGLLGNRKVGGWVL